MAPTRTRIGWHYTEAESLREWLDLGPCTKADEARAAWQQSRRQRFPLVMTITTGDEKRDVRVTTVRRLPKGGTRIRFEPIPLAVETSEQLAELFGKGAMGSKYREMT